MASCDIEILEACEVGRSVTIQDGRTFRKEIDVLTTENCDFLGIVKCRLYGRICGDGCGFIYADISETVTISKRTAQHFLRILTIPGQQFTPEIYPDIVNSRIELYKVLGLINNIDATREG